MIWPDGNHQRQADGRPDGIAPANPIPESENPILRDAEGRHLVECGGNSREMRWHRRFAQLLDNPAPGCLGVGHGFDGGEGLGGDEEQRCRRVQGFQSVGDMGAVHIRHIMQLRPVMVRCQRQRGHGGAEVRAANADVHHIGDLARPHALGKFRHISQNAPHLWHHVAACHHDRRL